MMYIQKHLYKDYDNNLSSKSCLSCTSTVVNFCSKLMTESVKSESILNKLQSVVCPVRSNVTDPPKKQQLHQYKPPINVYHQDYSNTTSFIHYFEIPNTTPIYDTTIFIQSRLYNNNARQKQRKSNALKLNENRFVNTKNTTTIHSVHVNNSTNLYNNNNDDSNNKHQSPNIELPSVAKNKSIMQERHKKDQHIDSTLNPINIMSERRTSILRLQNDEFKCYPNHKQEHNHLLATSTSNISSTTIRLSFVSSRSIVFNLCPVHVVITTTTNDNKVKTFSLLINIREKAIRDMPHTILTFLRLIQSGLYSNTTIEKVMSIGSKQYYHYSSSSSTTVQNQRRVIIFGQPTKEQQQQPNWYQQRYNIEYGLTLPYSTKFLELSPFAPCNQYSIGLYPNGRGPYFVLFLDDDDSTNDDDTTIGTNHNNQNTTRTRKGRAKKRPLSTHSYCFALIDNVDLFGQLWFTNFVNNALNEQDTFQTITSTTIQYTNIMTQEQTYDSKQQPMA
jgi:hypothetical protein